MNFTFRAVAQGTFISTNQKHNPVLCSDTSSVWNFWARFSDVISQGKAEVLSRNVGCLPRLTVKEDFARESTLQNSTSLNVHWEIYCTKKLSYL